MALKPVIAGMVNVPSGGGPFTTVSFTNGSSIISPQNGTFHFEGDAVASKIIFGENEGELTLTGSSGRLNVRNNTDTADVDIHANALLAETNLSIAGTQVVGLQQPAIADSAEDLADLTSKFNTLLAELRTHGLIDT